MFLRCTVCIVLYIFLFAILSLPTCAVAADKILKVGISPFTPFVMPSESKHKGFSVDLWKTIAQQGSMWREKINRTLLDLIESGDYQRIHTKWFGEAK